MTKGGPPDPIAILKTARTVAVIGASSRIHRPSHHAVEMLVQDGYSVIPVNPRYEKVHGIRCYPDFDEVPDSIEVDIVNVFRRPEAVPGLLGQVAERAHRTGRTATVWAQLGVSSPPASERAAELSLPYIEEQCIMVELERLAGRKR